MFSRTPPVFLLRPESIELLASGDGYTYEPLAPGVLGPPRAEDRSRYELSDPLRLSEAIAACARRWNRPIKRARLALDGALVRQITLPLAFVPPREELREALRSEIERYALFAQTHVVFDFVVVKQEAGQLTCLCAAFRGDYVDQVCDAFRAAGVELNTIEPAALPLARALVNDHPSLIGADSEAKGVALLTSNKLDLFVWADGQARSWRRVYMDSAGITRGVAAATDEAERELIRAVGDASVAHWLLVGFPDALVTDLRARTGKDLVSQSLSPTGEPHAWLRAINGEEPASLTLDMLGGRSAKDALDAGRRIAVLSLAAGILVVGIVAGSVLDSRANQAKVALAQVTVDTEARQAALRQASNDNGVAVLASKLSRSEAGARLMLALRDQTPADAWISRADLDTSSTTLSLDGFALSRSSPGAFAQALGELPQVSAVALPEVAVDQAGGKQVYRFRIVATVKLEESHP